MLPQRKMRTQSEMHFVRKQIQKFRRSHKSNSIVVFMNNFKHQLVPTSTALQWLSKHWTGASFYFNI